MVLFAGGVAWASTAGLGTPYLAIAAEIFLIGAKIGLTTSPGTESVMLTVKGLRRFRCARIWGIDPSPEMLSQSRKRQIGRASGPVA